MKERGREGGERQEKKPSTSTTGRCVSETEKERGKSEREREAKRGKKKRHR